MRSQVIAMIAVGFAITASAGHATYWGLPCIDYKTYRTKLVNAGWKPVGNEMCGGSGYKEVCLGNRMGSATWLSPDLYKINMPLWGNKEGGYCLVPQADEDKY